MKYVQNANVITDNHNQRKNDATDKKYILLKMGLKFRNPKFDILCNIPLYFSIKNMNPLKLWDTILEQLKVAK